MTHISRFSLALGLACGACSRTQGTPTPVASSSSASPAGTSSAAPGLSPTAVAAAASAAANEPEDAGPPAPMPSDSEQQAAAALKTLPTDNAAFVKTSLDARAMTRIIAAAVARGDADAGTLDMARELARFVGNDFRFFGDELGGIASRSSTPIPESMTLSTAPVVWRPDDEHAYLVATGRAKASSVIVAFRLGGERAELVSAFVMRHDVAPVALAYDRRARKELYWSSCWKCPGEHGAIAPREPGRVVIVQY